MRLRLRLRFATVLLLLGTLLGGAASAGAYAAAPRVVPASDTAPASTTYATGAVTVRTDTKAADESQSKPKKTKKKKKSKGGVGLIIGIIAVIAIIIVVMIAVRRVRKARGGR
ncbi:hypothetical protein [Streptomyces sp. NPDC055189]